MITQGLLARTALNNAVNFLHNPVSEALYFAQVFVTAAVALIVIVLSARAYRQTRFVGFLFWIVSSVIALCGTIGWDVVGHAYSYPRLYPAAVIAYRMIYLINALISFLGTILVIREFVRLVKSLRREQSSRPV